MRKFLAELLGTFALVFAGTGAIVIDAASHGAVTHAGVALTFGLVVLALIYTFGDVCCGLGRTRSRSVRQAVCWPGRGETPAWMPNVLRRPPRHHIVQLAGPPIG